MSLIHYNSLRIEGNNNIVLQDTDGQQITTTINAFVSNITSEKDKRIADLERTIEDKRQIILGKEKIENYSDAEIQRLGRELTQLKEERHFLEQRIEEMLREFDGKDLSTTSKMYQEAFNLFVSGQLQEAIDFLTEAKMAAEEAKAQAIIQQQAQTRRLKADMLVLTFDFAGAAHNYEKAVTLFPSWGNHLTAANFYLNQKNYQKVEAYYLLAFSYAENDEQKATTLNNLGVYYSNNQKMLQAEGAYNEALIIYKQLADKNPDVFLPDLAMTLNNLAGYYYNNQKMPEAEAAFNETLNIYWQLAQINLGAFLPSVAMTLNNLGVYYQTNQKMPQAEATFKEALKFYKQLDDNNPNIFSPYVAMIFNNLGEYYRENRKMPQAEAAYNEALNIKKQLADKKPDAFLPDLAMTLNNLGIYYIANEKMPQADAAFNETLNIYKQLAKINPDAFLPAVATALNNIVLLNFRNPEEAEKYLVECLPIRRKLAQTSPDAQNLELARTLIIGGFIYNALKNAAQSQEYFIEALSIAEKYPKVPFAQQLIEMAKPKIKE